MSTPQSAQVMITNTSAGAVNISLWHQNADYSADTATWNNVQPNQTVGPLAVRFNTGLGSLIVRDYWACEIEAIGGSTVSAFESTGVTQYSKWKECQLQSSDAGQTLTFQVNTKTFTINMPSGGTSTQMNAVSRSSAKAYVTNSTNSHATITLWHSNATDGLQTATWTAAPGQKVGPLTVYFRVGFAAMLQPDYWALKLVAPDGSAPGVYASYAVSASNGQPNLWTECQLQQADVGKDLQFAVTTSSFNVGLVSGGTSVAMNNVAPSNPEVTPSAPLVDNVFVLMLENHSFDNIFAFSKIKGLTVATPANNNVYLTTTYPVGSSAPAAMPTDPGHEFADVREQLCGQGASLPMGRPYNPNPGSPNFPTNSGFVANYATSTTEIVSPGNPSLPKPAQWGDIMQCFDTPSDLPVIYQLATTFAVCDHWFSSIPGPTWPNRFFVHGASSGGWSDSPTALQIGEMKTLGFTYPCGDSLFDRLTGAGMHWRIYQDPTGALSGSVAQVSALAGIGSDKVSSFGSFADDVQGPYPFVYTFIEPNYGDTFSGSYVGGSSQHPNDFTGAGEALIKATYEAIRNSPLWERSLLIVIYDEHGGFYDSVPPPAAPAPEDGDPQSVFSNLGGFLFDWYGVRVPAVIVSPRIAEGTVDHTVYDHASVAATLKGIYRNFDALTQRDSNANNVLHLLSPTTLRTNCPTTLHNPAPGPGTGTPPPQATLGAAAPDAAARAASPLPATGNAQGFLGIVAKTDAELAGGDPAKVAAIQQRVAAIKTVGEADAYTAEVMAKARQAKGEPAEPPPPRLPQPPAAAPASAGG